jgi:hypothetical protein
MLRRLLLSFFFFPACASPSDDGPNLTFSTSLPPAEETSSTGDGESTGTSVADSTTADDTVTSTTGVATDDESTGSAPAECGNGIQEAGEVCDGDDFGGSSCESLGFESGDLVCSSDCKNYSTAGCFICGNGVVEGAEACDGSVPVDVTCETEGFTEGTIACDARTCQFDTSECTLCGDDVAEGNEDCDGQDLAGQTCESLGLLGGDLACDAGSCMYVVSGCDSFIEDFESGAMGAYWTYGGNANWTIDSNNPIAGSFSAISGVITHNQQTGMIVTLDYVQDSTISFWHAESTENNFDYLRFYIDGIEQGQWSGSNPAQEATYNVTAGVHTFEWRYTKDGSVNAGQDRVWVDDIYAPAGQLD